MRATMPGLKQDSNKVKVAIHVPNQSALLFEINQKQHLTAVVEEVCMNKGIPEPEQYALSFADRKLYITEKNRSEIINGSMLNLVLSPSRTAENIVETLKRDKGSFEEKLDALKKLSDLSSDTTFTAEFISKFGPSLLIDSIEAGKYSGEQLSYALHSFVELMEHGHLSWEIIKSPFINKVSALMMNTHTNEEPKTLQASLAILENLLLNSQEKGQIIEKIISLPNVLPHLKSSERGVQQNCVALMNALFMKADGVKKKSMASILSSSLQIIYDKIILPNFTVSKESGSEMTHQEIGSEMAHQLYVLQTLLLNQLEDQMNTPLDIQSQEAHNAIKELRNTAFDIDPENQGTYISGRKQGAAFAKDYKKLGFQNEKNPTMDFTETPPGVLALDCMMYFARKHQEEYTKMVLENSCKSDVHECPFGRASIELTKLLREILKIGEPHSQEGEAYYPMFFSPEQPFFKELFCVCINLVNKTWKEMRAITEDFAKVFSVVREQIRRGMATNPVKLSSFRDELKNLTYQQIMKLWQQERVNKETLEHQAQPIKELREQITPEIKELIHQQRLGFLVEGTRFTRYVRGQRRKDMFWYCRLSPNHKVFHHGDCDEKNIPALEELPNKIPVVDIKALLVGKECPPMKDAKKKSPPSLAFSIQWNNNTTVDFVAPDQNKFDYWVDGINALLGKEITSPTAKSDLETLLNLDMKLRLLDVEGIDIPTEPPPIPKEPPNYEFCYDPK